MPVGSETICGELAFSERGEGRAIFLVHAGVFSEWFRLVERSPALDGFRVIRVRRAGYGPNRPAEHLTLTAHGRHVATLAAHLGIEQLHWVGHSSSCQIGLALAGERPDLVRSLVLMEPAAGGGFGVPASADLGPAFFGPAMGAFQRGDVSAAFDHFMRGVCGDDYRAILESHLGREGVEQAIRESKFFFQDEIRAVMESNFGPAEAAQIKQHVLCLEGGDQPPHLRQMSRQISERVVQLLPQAKVVIVPGANHALPLQQPDAVAQAIASFILGLD